MNPITRHGSARFQKDNILIEILSGSFHLETLSSKPQKMVLRRRLD
jgi:hypothetical protein